jgi:protocatechuate 3,4-dioxygenase, alpha subunit
MPELAATPGQTIGPFFHYALPYPGDRELVPPGSAGSVRLHGHVYDGEGHDVPDALLEIRQADPAGTVPTGAGPRRRDGAPFTGWGRSSTDASGHYWFSSVSVSRGWVSSKAVSKATVRDTTVAPGCEVLPAIAPSFRSVEV